MDESLTQTPMNSTNYSMPATIAAGVLGCIGGTLMLLPTLSLATIPELTDKGRANLIQLIAIGAATAATGGAALALDELTQP